MDGFPFTTPIEVRFRDLDAMGHVNNAVFVTYLEMGRVAFFRDVFQVTDASGFDFILARVEIDFRKPILLRDPCCIGMRVSHVGRSSFTFEYRLEAAGELAATAKSVQVSFDYATKSSKSLSDAFRARLAPYLGSSAAEAK